MIRPQKNTMFKRESAFTRMENRIRSDDRYHSSRWTNESREFRRLNPLCVNCQKKGIIKASEVTDHVVPVSIHPNFWDKTNWQALCKSCNIEKGNQDKQLIHGKK